MAADRRPAIKRFALRHDCYSKIIISKRLRTNLVFAHERPERPAMFMGITGRQGDVALAARQCVRKISTLKLGNHH